MVSKAKLSAKNLEAFGAERLAELLMEISAGNALIKRRLRLELAAARSPTELARQIRKRLSEIARSRSFVDGHNRRDLINDLKTQHRAIVDQVAKADPAEALDLLWQFLGLANSTIERCDDSNGTVLDIFYSACGDIGNIAKAAKVQPIKLADNVFDAWNVNDYGQYDDLITDLAPALGQTGLEHLKQRMIALLNEQIRKPSEEERQIIGWGLNGPLYGDDMAVASRTGSVRLALMDIADAQGDVDAFISQYDKKARKAPAISAQIAQRLLAAGRAQDAWQTLEAAEPPRIDWPDFEWENARIEVLDALGRTDEAQSARWASFERSLSAPHLRAYLKRLADFDDVEAEERALKHVQESENLSQALSFLVSWPALDRAAKLVVQRAGELDGDNYEILAPAAEALAGRFPLAATLLLRAMIDFSLTRNRSSRYRHAARHLADCASLAAVIKDYGAFETHQAYAGRLSGQHSRKSSFWSLVP